MNPYTFFDFYEYLSGLTASNKLAQEQGFHFCTCTGITALEGVLTKLRSKSNFLCCTDTTVDDTWRNGQGGWYKRRSIIVFILMRYKQGDMDDWRAKMVIARELFRQFQSKLLVDSQQLLSDMTYLDIDTFHSQELGAANINGATGLMFELSCSEPTNIVYNADEWE